MCAADADNTADAGTAVDADTAAGVRLSKAPVWLNTSTPLAHKVRPASATVLQSQSTDWPPKTFVVARPGTSPGKQRVKVNLLA